MVHTSEDFGTTVSEAIFVAPERTTYIGMKMVKITRLPSPFPEHCADSWPEGMVSSRIDKGSYSQQVCLKICLQQTIERNCKCQSATLPQLELNSTDLRFCDTRRRGMCPRICKLSVTTSCSCFQPLGNAWKRCYSALRTKSRAATAHRDACE